MKRMNGESYNAMIERYKRELIEFAKKNGQLYTNTGNESPTADEEMQPNTVIEEEMPQPVQESEAAVVADYEEVGASVPVYSKNRPLPRDYAASSEPYMPPETYTDTEAVNDESTIPVSVNNWSLPGDYAASSEPYIPPETYTNTETENDESTVAVSANNRPLPRDYAASAEPYMPPETYTDTEAVNGESTIAVSANNRPLPRDYAASAEPYMPPETYTDTETVYDDRTIAVYAKNRPLPRDYSLSADSSVVAVSSAHVTEYPKFDNIAIGEWGDDSPQDSVPTVVEPMQIPPSVEAPRLYNPPSGITEAPPPQRQQQQVYSVPDEYTRINPRTGWLKVQVYSARNAVPVQNAHINVSKDLGSHRHTFFEGFTDISGIVSDIALPAPEKSPSVASGRGIPYATYDLDIAHPRFAPISFKDIPVFEGIESLQPVSMQTTDSRQSDFIPGSEPFGMQ